MEKGDSLTYAMDDVFFDLKAVSNLHLIKGVDPAFVLLGGKGNAFLDLEHAGYNSFGMV